MAPEYPAAPANTPPSYQSKNRKTSHEDLRGPFSDSKVAAKGREELQFLIRDLLSPQPESIDVDSVNRFDKAEPREPGQGKGATQKRAYNTDQDLDHYHQFHDKFFSNYDRKREIPSHRYARASSEGPNGFQEVLILSDDDSASPGTMTSNSVDADNHSQDKDTTKNHISEVDEVPANDFSSLRGLDDPFIAIENLKKDSPHTRGTPKKPADDQNTKRHISEIDEANKKKEEIGASTSEHVRDQEPLCANQEPTKRKQHWKYALRYNTNTIISTSTLPPSPAPRESKSVMGKVVGVGAPQPRNTLDKKIDLYNGFPNYERSNKRRKIENHSTVNGSSGRPINVDEQDAGSERLAVEQTSVRADPHTRPRAESDILSGMSPATSRSFVHHIDNHGIAPSRKSRNSRRKLQKQINSSSGSRSDQVPLLVHGSPGQRTNNHRLHVPRILHSPERHDSTGVDELNDSNILSTASLQARIPHNGTAASKKTARQAPTTSANGHQTSQYFAGNHASQRSSKNSAGMLKRQPLVDLELSGSEDELSQQHDPSATEMQKPTRKTFGTKQEFDDVSSIENRGDINPTDFGNRGTGDHKKRQNDKAERMKSYKLVSIFSETQYWVRPEDVAEWFLLQDVSTGDLTLIRDQDSIDGFTIRSKSINRLTRCLESEKIIIEKSTDNSSIAQGPKIFIELKTEDASSSLSNILEKAMGSPAVNVEASQMDKKIANMRKKVLLYIEREDHMKQAARSMKHQEELPKDLELMHLNRERRGRSRKLENEGDADFPRQSKKLKLRDGMKADHNSDLLEDDDVQVQRPSTAITPSKFYGDGEVTGRTRATLRSAAKPKISREPPKPRTPSPERWTRTHPGWDKNWLKSVIYPATGKKTATVDKQDIERLDEGEFLNDNLIMFYLYWLEQHNSHLASRVYVHNTFFYASLTNTAKGNRGINYEAVQRWTAKVDLPSYDYIIVPVNEHTHWYVAIICNASRLLEPETISPTQSLEEPGTSIKEQAAIQSEQNLISPSPKPADLNVDNAVGGGISQLSLQEIGSAVGMDGQKNEENSPTDTLPLNHGLPAEVIEVESRNGINISAVSPTNNSRPHSSAGDPKTPATKGRRKSSHPPRVYDPKEPRIITFDSLGMAHSATCRNLRDYIVREINTRTGVSVTPPKFLGMTAKNIAAQNNYCDCGVFLLGYMEEFFARPDAFIEDIMQSKYDNEAYKTNPSKLRAKIRDIVFGLQDELRKAEEARKSKQVKVKAKKEQTKEKTAVEPLVSESASNPPSKSTRTSPAVELPNNEKSPISSAQALAPPSPAPQAPKAIPEVIDLDDNQDQVGYEHNDSVSAVVQHPASVPIEDPLPKQHVSPKATSPAPEFRRHRPTRSFGKLEIPDSQEERAADNQGDDGHANESQNSQVVSLVTRTADPNQQPAVDIVNNGTETKTPMTAQSILSGLYNSAKTFNRWATRPFIETVAPEEDRNRYSSAHDRDQSPAILPEKTDVRVESRASQYPDTSTRSKRRTDLRSPSPLSGDDDYARKHTSNADEEVGLVIAAKSIPRKAASANPVDLTEDDEHDVMLLDSNFPDVPLLPISSPVSLKTKQPPAHIESAVVHYKRKRTPAQRETSHGQAAVDLTSSPKERSSKEIPNHQGYPMNNFKSRDAAEDAMIRRQKHGH